MRLGYPHVLGELLAGIIFGPPLLGWIRGDAGIVPARTRGHPHDGAVYRHPRGSERPW